MHVSEGVLPLSVLIGGAAIAVTGTAIGLRRLDYNRIPQAGVLAASFFVASLIHVPLGVSSVHLVLNGVVGMMLGWGAFPVILIALILQAVFFQFGGITTLGVNTVVMALPAVLVSFAFNLFKAKNASVVSIISFLCGFFSVLLAALMMGFALFLMGEAFFEVATFVVISYLPVMIVEGIITLFCIRFLMKVQPSILYGTVGRGNGQS
ncbi:MAG: cobalt transporter CbiM [Deltaproteobacteria bacterium]|nr:cobalt transporter CbiM [Deltaproteobacteria bacterium]